MTIAVAMSGGVDSSTAAALLAENNPQESLIGLTMQLWNQRRLAGHDGMPEAVTGRCCSIDDVYDARRVAEHNGDTGLGARYTRSRRPVELVYVEAAANRAEAARREAAIKRLDRARKLALCASTP